MVCCSSRHPRSEAERGILGQFLLQSQLTKKFGARRAMAAVVRSRSLLKHLVHRFLDLLLIAPPEHRVRRRLQIFVDRRVGLRQAATGDLLHFGIVPGATELLGVLDEQVLRSSLRDGCHSLEAGTKAGLVRQLHSLVGMTGCTNLLDRKALFTGGRGENRVLLLFKRHFLC